MYNGTKVSFLWYIVCTYRVSPHDYYLGFTGVTHDEVCNVLYMRSCSEEWEVDTWVGPETFNVSNA